MDGHEHEGLSNDALERDIEAVFGVDPSPEFLPRLRARIADEGARRDRRWFSPWRWVGGAAVVAGVVVVALWSLRDPVPAPREARISTPTAEPSGTAPDAPALAAPPGLSDSPGLQSKTRPTLADSPGAEGRPATRTVRSTRQAAGGTRDEVVISSGEVVALRQLVVAIVARQVTAVDIPELGVESAPLPAIEEIVLEPITLSPIDEALE